MAADKSSDAGPGLGVYSVTARLQEILMSARAAGDQVAILMVHVGAIDRVDAMHGLHAGDELLAGVIGRLKAHLLRRFDCIEAVSRNELVCALRPMPSEGLAMLAAQRTVTLLTSPIEYGGTSAVPEVTVGIAMFPADGGDAAELLKNAKHALRTAHGHREPVRQYENHGTRSGTDRLQYEQRLRIALERNSLELHFQPQLNLRTGKVERAEALLRWNDEVLGRVAPNLLIEAAEAAGLIDRVTLWVVTTAVQRCAEFQRLSPRFSVSVNVSPSNLAEPDLPLYVDRALRTWGVGGTSLVAEITETAMMADQTKAQETLGQLKSYGTHISIDDFGTGYSSMYYLARLPLDELKIDIMFVRNMLNSPQDAKIVRSLIDLAHNLDLEVVAEGVENGEIQSALQHLGCDFVQGYHIAKPMPAGDLAALLREQQAAPASQGDRAAS